MYLWDFCPSPQKVSLLSSQSFWSYLLLSLLWSVQDIYLRVYLFIYLLMSFYLYILFIYVYHLFIRYITCLFLFLSVWLSIHLFHLFIHFNIALFIDCGCRRHAVTKCKSCNVFNNRHHVPNVSNFSLSSVGVGTYGRTDGQDPSHEFIECVPWKGTKLGMLMLEACELSVC